jgi:hypothetical protein
MSESRLVMGILAAGFAPAVWAASMVIEWHAGRGIWHFTAPYPYRWMREHGEAVRTAPTGVRAAAENAAAPEDRPALPLAA